MAIAHCHEVALSKLRRNPRNTRTHPKKQIRQIADSIKQVGFTSPIIANENYVVLAGHGRPAPNACTKFRASHLPIRANGIVSQLAH